MSTLTTPAVSDYASWSSEKLVARVMELEKKLKEQMQLLVLPISLLFA
jgi:hypothetical protein